MSKFYSYKVFSWYFWANTRVVPSASINSLCWVYILFNLTSNSILYSPNARAALLTIEIISYSDNFHIFPSIAMLSCSGLRFMIIFLYIKILFSLFLSLWLSDWDNFSEISSVRRAFYFPIATYSFRIYKHSLYFYISFCFSNIYPSIFFQWHFYLVRYSDV